MPEVQSQPQSVYELFCHENTKCTLAVAGHEELNEFESVTEAMRAVLERAGPQKSLLKVYNAIGEVVYQTFI